MADTPATSLDKPPKKNAALLKHIREEFARDVEAEHDNWEEGGDDLKFLALDQWKQEDKDARDAENRPWLTFDLIGEKINQITGDMRMNRPAIKVRPAEDNDVDLSEILTGQIRHIEAASDAQTAYTTAGISAARVGVGNFRIVTQYTDDEGFEQEIRIQRMKHPFSVVWDMDSTEITREDAKHCYVLSSMSKPAFEALYPDADVSDFDTQTPDREEWVGDWYKQDRITVAEYWVKEPVRKTIALTTDGKSVDITGQKRDDVMALGTIAMDPAGRPRIRDVKTHRVVQYIVNGSEILEGPTEWAGKHIPIIPVFGEEIDLGDQTVRFGIVRRAKDQQRIANFTISAAVETLALSPKAPFIGTTEQFTGVEKYWKEANTMNWPFLPYNHDPKAPGPPQRQQPPTLNLAALELFRMSAEGVKAGMGVHDAAIGARSNETSGKAILARQRESDVGSYIYVDNLAKAVAYCGRQLVDLIPKIYDTERTIRILGEDGAQKFEKVNSTTDAQGLPMKEGQLFNDLSLGTYDVVVETGPSFSTKRQEAAEAMQQFMMAVPTAGPIIQDLYVKNLDVPMAEEMRKRLKKTLPPGLAEPDDDEEPQPPPPAPEEIAAAQAEAQLKVEAEKAEQAHRHKLEEAEQKHRHDLDLADHKAQLDRAAMADKAAAGLEQTIVGAKVRDAGAERQAAIRGEQDERKMVAQGEQAERALAAKGEQAERQTQMKAQPALENDAIQMLMQSQQEQTQAIMAIAEQLAGLQQMLGQMGGQPQA